MGRHAMLAKVKTAAVVDFEGHLLEVEVDISSGLPSMTIVRLSVATAEEPNSFLKALLHS